MNLRFFFLSCVLVGFAAPELATAAPVPTHETLRVTEKILYRFKGGSDGAHHGQCGQPLRYYLRYKIQSQQSVPSLRHHL